MGGPTGGGDGKAPKTPKTPTSRFAKDTVAIDATDAALKRMTTTITTQVSPAVRGLSDAFVSIKESVKATATEVITLDDKINVAKSATSGFATAVTGLKTALSDVSKLAAAITTEMTAAGSAVTSTNLGLKLTLSNLAAIRVEQALVNAGYAAHTASIAATNLALTQQIALLQTSRAMLTGGGAVSMPAGRAHKQSTHGAQGLSTALSATTGASYEDKLYGDFASSARAIAAPSTPIPQPASQRQTPLRDAQGRFTKRTASITEPVFMLGGSTVPSGATNLGSATHRLPATPPHLPAQFMLQESATQRPLSLEQGFEARRPLNPDMDGTKALSKIVKDGIKVINTKDIAKGIGGELSRLAAGGWGALGSTGTEKAFNVFLAAQAVMMGYQFGKALDARFGVIISDVGRERPAKVEGMACSVSTNQKGTSPAKTHSEWGFNAACNETAISEMLDSLSATPEEKTTSWRKAVMRKQSSEHTARIRLSHSWAS